MKIKILILLMFLTAYFKSQYLDSTFGNNGNLLLQGIGAFFGTAIQNDGKLVLAGKTSDNKGLLCRLNPDGSFDNTFGVAGKLIFHEEQCNYEVVSPAKILDDGSIVLLYDGSNNNNSFRIRKLVKLKSNGSLDESFNSTTICSDFTLLSNGKIIVVPGFGNKLIRLNNNGSIDTSFGNMGIKTLSGVSDINYLETDPLTNDVFLMDSNSRKIWKINNEGMQNMTSYSYSNYVSNIKFFKNSLFLSGGVYNSDYVSTSIRKLNANFTLDQSFGSSGTVSMSNPKANIDLIFQNDEKALQLNFIPYGNEIQIARFNTIGTVDNFFGNQGKFDFQPGIDRIYSTYFLYNKSNTLYVISTEQPNNNQVTNFRNVVISKINIDGNLSILESKKQKLILYPNPATSFIYFSKKINSIELFSKEGKKIETTTANKSLSVSNLNKGIYILKGVDENGNAISEKFIKK
ncbi:T9SS type A sorting domain-containing protein [Epilithonimonas mollis]|nr:T9SS type A sorting domain-containing protein [Epilithonimonas mollis]